MKIPAKGSKWQRPGDNSVLRVMSDPIEGWLMVRFTGAMPFVVRVTEIHDRFVPLAKGAKQS